MSAVSVGLFRSPAAFRSFSMDRYADSLEAALRAASPPELSLQEVRPPDRQRLLPGRLDRYWSRYPQYWVHARRTSFNVNHVLDHAYGHLTYALDGDRTIVSCHDIFPLQHWRGAIRGLERRRTRPLTVQLSLSGLRRARFVVTSSEATKDDVVDVLALDPERVRVVPYGIDASFAPASAPRENNGPATILCVSTGAPYKNHRAAVEVLARVVKRSERDVRLVRVGPPLPPAEAERSRRYGLRERTVELGQLPEAGLADAYRRSDVLLHPSLYEGFGWPPLEAMASGVPVVVSTWRSLLEVTDGAALRADPQDYDGLADCVLTALEDERVTQKLRLLGLERARQFSWHLAAQRQLELYRTIAAERGAA
jgi:glycosyltransferase involved in cell wall biosynthesis